MIRVIPRGDWGAKYGTGSPDPGPEQMVVIHHSYLPALREDATEKQEIASVRGIERYHVELNGWAGIGYNWLVAPSGRVYEGRGWTNRGAHAGPVNGDSIGVCLLIDGSQTEPPEAAIRAVRALIREGLAAAELAPTYTVSGHRDHMAGRTCPGDLVYRRLQEFRHDAGRPAAEGPKVGERRWSAYFGEPVILTRFISDDEWYFLRESQLDRVGMKASTEWSQMPREP